MEDLQYMINVFKWNNEELTIYYKPGTSDTN